MLRTINVLGNLSSYGARLYGLGIVNLDKYAYPVLDMSWYAYSRPICLHKSYAYIILANACA